MGHTLLKNLIRMMLLVPFLLAGCMQQSAPSNAPQSFVVTPGDGQVTISWNEDTSLVYWLFSAQAASITTSNYSSLPAGSVIWPAHSPQVITGLTNGKTYSFIMNSTKNGSPAGPATDSVAVVPRQAGINWTVGSPIGSVDLNRLGYGNGFYAAIGKGGAIYTSPYSSIGNQVWTSQTSNTTADLRAVFFDNQNFLVMGANGALVTSTDGVTWKSVNTGDAAKAETFNSLAGGGGVYLAVGQNGAIYTGTPDTITATTPAAWLKQNSGTTANLNGVLYNGAWRAIAGTSNYDARYVAVGDAGTMLIGEVVSTTVGTTTTYTTNWTKQALPTTAKLNGIAFDSVLATYFAVGANGTLLTSTDTVTWVPVMLPTTQDLYAVSIRTNQSGIALVGAGGTVVIGTPAYDSVNKTWSYTWNLANSGTSANLYGAMALQTGYVAVGANGANTRSF